MIAIVHTYAPTPIMINIKPYYTFGRIKQLITKESGIKSCEQKLYWQDKIMHDKEKQIILLSSPNLIQKCLQQYLLRKEKINFPLVNSLC